MYFLYLIEFAFIVLYVYNKFIKVDYNSFENSILRNDDDGFKLFDTPSVPTEIINNKCNQSGGMYAVLVKYDGIDTYECLNAYPLIFDNHGRVHNHVCKNGRINYGPAGAGLPTGDDFCTCDRLGYTKMLFHNIPVCVKNVNLYT